MTLVAGPKPPGVMAVSFVNDFNVAAYPSAGESLQSGSLRTPDEIAHPLAMLVEKAAAGLKIAVITGRQGQVLGLGELLGIGDHADSRRRAFGRGGRARRRLGIGGFAFRDPFQLGGRSAAGTLWRRSRHQPNEATRAIRAERAQLLGATPAVALRRLIVA